MALIETGAIGTAQIGATVRSPTPRLWAGRLTNITAGDHRMPLNINVINPE
jgi:hypothetical protein